MFVFLLLFLAPSPKRILQTTCSVLILQFVSQLCLELYSQTNKAFLDVLPLESTRNKKTASAAGQHSHGAAVSFFIATPS